MDNCVCSVCFHGRSIKLVVLWAAGVWLEGSDGTDINALCRSHSERLVAVADDFCKVHLFQYPCPKLKVTLAHVSSLLLSGAHFNDTIMLPFDQLTFSFAALTLAPALPFLDESNPTCDFFLINLYFTRIKKTLRLKTSVSKETGAKRQQQI